MRPRDNQKQKVYNWESQFEPRPRNLLSMEAMQAFVFEAYKDYHPDGRPPIVTDGRRRRSAAAASKYKIMMPTWSRVPYILLHELAHILTPLNKAPHGPEFVRMYIDLMVRYMGIDEKEAYRSAIKAHIKVGVWAKSPKPKRRLKKSIKELLKCAS